MNAIVLLTTRVGVAQSSLSPGKSAITATQRCQLGDSYLFLAKPAVSKNEMHGAADSKAADQLNALKRLVDMSPLLTPTAAGSRDESNDDAFLSSPLGNESNRPRDEGGTAGAAGGLGLLKRAAEVSIPAATWLKGLISSGWSGSPGGPPSQDALQLPADADIGDYTIVSNTSRAGAQGAGRTRAASDTNADSRAPHRPPGDSDDGMGGRDPSQSVYLLYSNEPRQFNEPASDQFPAKNQRLQEESPAADQEAGRYVSVESVKMLSDSIARLGKSWLFCIF